MKRKVVLFMASVAVTVLGALLVGCRGGSSEDEVARLAVQQQQMEQRLAERLDAITSRLDAETRALSELREELGRLRSVAALAERETPGDASASVAGVAPTAVEPAGAQPAGGSDAAYLTLAAGIEELRMQMASVQGGIEAIRSDATQREERARMRDPREMWTALGEPQQLTQRLDKLAEAFAPQIEDLTLREQFKTDVAALKTSVLNPQGTPEERVARLRQELQEQIAATTNEQARRWMERRLEGLNNATPETLTALLENYTREQNGREVRTLAEKYNVPRQALEDAGLPAWGGRGDRMGPGGRFRDGGGGGAGGGGRPN